VFTPRQMPLFALGAIHRLACRLDRLQWDRLRVPDRPGDTQTPIGGAGQPTVGGGSVPGVREQEGHRWPTGLQSSGTEHMTRLNRVVKLPEV